ncbi:MAG: gliding motility-associated C-terminal domain-containing protein [Bacteroidetes bacterium]|nr:MAG: gliding motility-associated C-terminal domain-containing protein [Bacteroidota bacterium]
MHNITKQNIKAIKLLHPAILSFFLFTVFFQSKLTAQCPPNIDFENGSFSGWTCYTGNTVALGNSTNAINLFPSGGPVPNYHTMYSAANDAGTLDFYGGFPVMCPNGSGYSVKLGNTMGGAEAEGISYEFTIPAGRNTYSLIYHYAVVFQDPNHLDFQQPRLVLEVTNVTDNQRIDCSSFTFFPNGSPLPGFFQSTNGDSTAVWCKDWSAVTINLNNQAGKTIRLFFKTADCTFRRHFGYAYIDVNTECSSEFVGATYCRDDTAVNVVAPYGYQSYTWYNNTFTQTLGSTQHIRFSPPPAVGTTIAVELIPYNGYGCLDTLYARLVDTLTLRANAGEDVLSCNKNPVMIGGNSKPGVVYTWSPDVGLSNPDISNPRANPPNTMLYELTVRSTGGGCMSKDSVLVTTSIIDSSMQVIGKTNFCVTTGDSAVFRVQPTDSIQWYVNGNPVIGANNTRYRANISGTYHAMLYTDVGCAISTRTETVLIETPRSPVIYPIQYAVINNPIDLTARNFGVSYLWKPPIYLDHVNIINPQFNSPLTDEEFIYTVTITTSGGCVTVDTQIVKTIKEVKVYIPTAFTPNNDGRNDLLLPITFGIKEIQYFRVFNRWGQLVFDIKSNQRGWNGTISGMQQPTSTFVWIFQGLGLDKKTYTQKGTVTLIR